MFTLIFLYNLWVSWGKKRLLYCFSSSLYLSLIKPQIIYSCLNLLFVLDVAGFSGGSVVKNPPAIAGDMGSSPELGRSLGEGNGNTTQYSCLGTEETGGLYSPSVQFSSVTQSCLTLCDRMDCSTPGFPVYHQHLELTQTHVLQVSDAIQPSHPLSSPSPSAFNLSQHQGLFQWVSSSHQVAKVLEFQLQHQSYQWIFRTDFL